MIRLLEHVALSGYTTFAIGGIARYFTTAASVADLESAIAFAAEKSIPYFILGGGSNTLVSDSGFDGVVIHITINEFVIDTTNNTVHIGAGMLFSDAVLNTTKQNLSGMELLNGIPGTFGGAVRGNAGAFGTEIQNSIVAVCAYNSTTKQTKVFSQKECTFDYRTSYFKQNVEWIILSAIVKLGKETKGSSYKKALMTLALRNERQIQDIKSAGSFFMNPMVHKDIQIKFLKDTGTRAQNERVPAGWLLDKVGLKGASCGGTHTSARSANYIINDGTASASDVIIFTDYLKQKVYSTFGVMLEKEITILGFQSCT